jgi:hypothetical protein
MRPSQYSGNGDTLPPDCGTTLVRADVALYWREHAPPASVPNIDWYLLGSQAPGSAGVQIAPLETRQLTEARKVMDDHGASAEREQVALAQLTHDAIDVNRGEP